MELPALSSVLIPGGIIKTTLTQIPTIAWVGLAIAIIVTAHDMITVIVPTVIRLVVPEVVRTVLHVI